MPILKMSCRVTAYSLMWVCRLALVPYFRPGDPAVAEAIRALAGRHACVLLANHGPVAAGRSLEAAVHAVEELEETAKLALLLQHHDPRLLSPAQIDELVDTFGLDPALSEPRQSPAAGRRVKEIRMSDGDAAKMIWEAWCAGRKLDALPEAIRPKDRAEAYAAQEGLLRASGQQSVGWKIAATSLAGQKHINVPGPLAGRLLGTRVLPDGMAGLLANNLMMVAEAEFAFRMGRDLPPRDGKYTVEEVLEAASDLHPTIEVPDLRFREFTTVGPEQLIADAACAGWFFVGDAAPASWRAIDL